MIDFAEMEIFARSEAMGEILRGQWGLNIGDEQDPPSAFISDGSTQSLGNGGSGSNLEFDELPLWDTDNLYSADKNDRFTIRTPGLYCFGLDYQINDVSGGLTQTWFVAYDQSGVSLRELGKKRAVGTSTPHFNDAYGSYVFEEGDYLEAWVYHLAGGTKSIPARNFWICRQGSGTRDSN